MLLVPRDDAAGLRGGFKMKTPSDRLPNRLPLQDSSEYRGTNTYHKRS